MLAGYHNKRESLRFGQLHDSLDELCRARCIRRGLITFHKVQLAGEGQKVQMKSRAAMHSVQECIDWSVRRYRAAREALLHLDPSGNWQDLYCTLDDRDNRGPGKEPEEVSASDGRYVPSWIWLSNSNATAGDPTQSTISPDEVNEDMRVEWAQCVACADCWEEEVVLLQEEMRRIVHFLEWKSKDWISRADLRANIVAKEVCLGLSAYACKQASIFHNLAIWFCQRWRSKLVSLSLSDAWATEFLNTQGILLGNPDTKKHESKHDPTKSPTVLPRPESLTTVTTAMPPISNNPKAGNDDSSSSSNDSDVNSSEFEESEYERWSE